MSTPVPSLQAQALAPLPAAAEAIVALARAHGVRACGELTVIDMGLDFRVVMVDDDTGQPWVLRIPRRADVVAKIAGEARVLAFLAARLSVAVPDWQVVSDELVAYPRLGGSPALSFDPVTHEVTWSFDRTAPLYTTSLAGVLAELHAIPVADAVAAGLPSASPEQVRREHLASLETVRQELGLGPELERTLRAWLDDDTSWPAHTTVVHGDLYAGHTLVDAAGRVRGLIDWTEAAVSDPSIDFTGHLMAFGEDELSRLMGEYERAGGRTWPSMARHIHARRELAPVRYGLFALQSGDEAHRAAARAQLGAA
jgi:macrolide phosphotransferase